MVQTIRLNKRLYTSQSILLVKESFGDSAKIEVAENDGYYDVSIDCDDFSAEEFANCCLAIMR
jgi:hypothetical protein